MERELVVLVLDDAEDFSQNVQARIERAVPNATVGHLAPDALRGLFDVLHARREARRLGQPDPPGNCELDAVDVAVIDYDLADLQLPSADGERLAYLARLYSRCGAIVGLNQFGQNSFDLTLRRGSMSYADLYVGADQVGSPHLWGESGAEGGLRVWSWPQIPALLARLRDRAQWIRARLDTPLTRAFNPLFDHALPREMESALGDRHLGSWREWAMSDACLQRKDKLHADEDLARVAAARVCSWLERVVLPPQDLLVDAPHLIMRYPGLLSDAMSPGDWASTRAFREISPRINAEAIGDCELDNWKSWMSRPVWLWPRVREAAQGQRWERVPEATLDYVFCEDTAEFVASELATPFECAWKTPFSKRYIRKLQDVSYQPSVRLLGGHR